MEMLQANLAQDGGRHEHRREESRNLPHPLDNHALASILVELQPGMSKAVEICYDCWKVRQTIFSSMIALFSRFLPFSLTHEFYDGRGTDFRTGSFCLSYSQSRRRARHYPRSSQKADARRALWRSHPPMKWTSCAPWPGFARAAFQPSRRPTRRPRSSFPSLCFAPPSSRTDGCAQEHRALMSGPKFSPRRPSGRLDPCRRRPPSSHETPRLRDLRPFPLPKRKLLACIPPCFCSTLIRAEAADPVLPANPLASF